jgi:hypothetical protein
MDKKQFRNQKLAKQTSRRQALAKLKSKIDLHPQKPRRKHERPYSTESENRR